jgi:hypothetical protein
MMARRAWAERELAEWRDRRANRLAQVEALQACHLHTFSIHLLPLKSPSSPEPRSTSSRLTQLRSQLLGTGGDQWAARACRPPARAAAGAACADSRGHGGAAHRDRAPAGMNAQ